MARVKYSGLIESINGSIGGTTFQNNLYGFTVKRKPNMVIPNSQRQIVRKGTFANIARLWQTLSSTERDAWATYAETYPRPTRLNPSAILNGQALFYMYHNFLWLYDAGAFLADPMATLSTFTGSTATLARSGGALNIVVDATFGTNSWFCMIFLSGLASIGSSKPIRTAKYIGGDFVTPSLALNLASSYQSIFGNLPASGDRVGIKLVFQRQETAQVVIPPYSLITVG